MRKPKKYYLVVLANHPPSKQVSDMVKEYRRYETYYTQIEVYRVTNSLTMKEFKRKFKFEDLPCLLVTTQIAATRKKREHFYGDDIETQVKKMFQKELRKNAKLAQRESAAALRVRLRKGHGKRQRDVIPAADDVQED